VRARAALAANLEVVATMTAKEGKATAYVCEEYTCKAPTTDVKQFAALLK
jgi:uncharacterized protein YyaL (SSP411 family)